MKILSILSAAVVIASQSPAHAIILHEEFIQSCANKRFSAEYEWSKSSSGDNWSQATILEDSDRGEGDETHVETYGPFHTEGSLRPITAIIISEIDKKRYSVTVKPGRKSCIISSKEL